MKQIEASPTEFRASRADDNRNTPYENAAYLRLIVSSASEAIYSVDRDGTTRLCNAAFLQMLGFDSESDVIGRKLHDVIHHTHPDGRHYPVENCPIYRCASTGEPAHVSDENFFRADGSAFPVEYWVHPIREGDALRGAICTFVDSTERRQSEAALRESEARFRAAVQAVEGVVWTNSAHGEMLGEQPDWAALTGQTLAEYQGYGWADAVHPDDAEPTIDAWRAAVDAKQAFIFEHRVRCHDGEYRLFSIRAIPSLEADGTIREWVGVHTDITDTRATQRRLRDSETQFRGVGDAIPGFIWTADADGGLEYASPTWHVYAGLAPDDASGANWTAFVHSDDRHSAARTWQASVASGEPYEAEFRIRAGDGSYHWWLVRARRHDDGVRRWIGTATELDAIVAARETLARSRAELERLVNERTADRDRIWQNSSDILVVVDAGGIFRSVSPAWTAILGHPIEDVVGHPLSDFLVAEDVEPTLAGLEVALSENLPSFENRYRATDGSVVDFSWRTFSEGDRVYAVGRDVTAQKAQERNLRETEEQLRQSQKLEAIGQLTGGVAHDFNNLLTVIRGSVDLLRRPGITPERRDRYVEAISETVDRAAKLTGQLLAFARRQALMPDTFEVGAAVNSLAEMIGTLTGSRISFDLNLPDMPVYIDADLSQFDTAIVNMIVNARDAMKGEGALTIAVSPVPAIPGTGAAAVPGDHVAVSITDTGPGIAPGAIDQIFEPFYTTKSVGQGTGLGLSQVYGFAKQSGGEVRVVSAPGAGATFTLYLPRVVAPTASADFSESRALVAEGEGICVLVVEDNDAVGTFAKHTLAELGYQTVFAENGMTALAELAQNAARFDVVFSDVMMPGMTGLELGSEIRRLHPGLPVVLTSGYSHVLAQHGSSGFELLHKPYSMEELSRKLQVAAAGRRARPLPV